jgi:hypothetical protein
MFLLAVVPDITPIQDPINTWIHIGQVLVVRSAPLHSSSRSCACHRHSSWGQNEGVDASSVMAQDGPNVIDSADGFFGLRAVACDSDRRCCQPAESIFRSEEQT